MLYIGLTIVIFILAKRCTEFQIQTGIYSIKEWIKAELDKLQ